MGSSRTGFEPGSHVRVVRAGGGFGDSMGMYLAPDDGWPLVIRDLPVGAYTARDEQDNVQDFSVPRNVEQVSLRVRGGELGDTDTKLDEKREPPAAPGTAAIEVEEHAGLGGRVYPPMPGGVANKSAARDSRDNEQHSQQDSDMLAELTGSENREQRERREEREKMLERPPVSPATSSAGGAIVEDQERHGPVEPDDDDGVLEERLEGEPRPESEPDPEGKAQAIAEDEGPTKAQARKTQRKAASGSAAKPKASERPKADTRADRQKKK